MSLTVGIVVPALGGGGAELVARRWFVGLTALGHEVVVYTYDASATDHSDVPNDLRRQFPAQMRAGRFAALPYWLRRQVHRDAVDVLLGVMTFSNLVALAAMVGRGGRRVPVVISEHNLPTALLAMQGGNWLAQRWLARHVYHRAAAAVAVSHAVGGDLLGGYGLSGSRVFVVPNPVLDHPAPQPAREPREVHAAFVGRLVPQKRPLLFVDVIGELNRRGVSARGTIIGDGPMRDAVADHAKRRGATLRFTGWQEPWWEALDADPADCLVLPSWVEGFGNVFVEAAARGIPSVAWSSSFGVGDAIVPGITGELSATDTPEGLADAVLRATAGVQDGQVAGWLARFSVANSATTLSAVLEDVVAPRPNRTA